jgi:hypothetical protein
MDSSFGAQSSDDLTSPFREHLDHCRHLDLQSQLVECADYIQNVDLLVMEFLEAYYLIERLWQPSAELKSAGDDGEGALVLESFYESLELRLVDTAEDEGERLVCVSGAVNPVPDDQHPALSRRGLDFVGLREGNPENIVLGVVQSSKDETVFLLLLRGLNALAELSPPLRVVQLGREILHGTIPEDARFSLQLGLAEPESAPEDTSLGQLTRDLAEAFSRKIAAVPQLSGTLEAISCVEIGPEALDTKRLTRRWSV